MLFSPVQKGQGLVEYALIIVLIAVVVLVILALLGTRVNNVFSRLGSWLIPGGAATQ
jgi:pilus assembly protein Flp/PilA